MQANSLLFGPRQFLIKSIDIVGRMAGAESLLAAQVGSVRLLTAAGTAQLYLKLLTFEFLLRLGPPQPSETAAALQKS